MEEIRSTDILDKEIQEDARKKAEKILKDSDEQCQKILSQVEQRLEDAKEEKKEYYEAKAQQYKKDLQSSLPLEKSRFLVSNISSSVASAINGYLKNIPQEKRIDLLVNMADRFKNFTETKTFDAKVYGFDVEFSRKKLEQKKLKINSFEKIDFVKSGETAVDGIDLHEGIILDSQDKSVKIRLTIEELVVELLDIYRNELAVTLFGGRLPE